MASSSSAAPTSNGIHKKEEHQFGWAISDKIVPEVNKQESVLRSFSSIPRSLFLSNVRLAAGKLTLR
jgi:hypothetical protein